MFGGFDRFGAGSAQSFGFICHVKLDTIDIDSNVIKLHNSLKINNLLDIIKNTYSLYFPEGRNEIGYYKLRSDFNSSFILTGTTDNNIHMLHILVQLSFNSLLRFSKNGYNVPFGKKEVDFDRIKNHQDVVNSKNFSFICGDYSDLDLNNVDKFNDLIYLDPPYLASKFQYGGWFEKEEKGLLEYLDNLNYNGYKFVLSNTFSHRSVSNQTLINWSKKYYVKKISMSYNSWTAAVSTVKTEENTSEVIISNFIF